MFVTIYFSILAAWFTIQVLTAAMKTLRDWKRAADVIDEETKRVKDLMPNE